MARYIFISIISGILFASMDGFINANPYAKKLYEVFEPISKKSINIPTGIAIDLMYGFALAGIFLLLFKSLPGESSIMKGISYAFMIWFFRTAMAVASNWMMFNIPLVALIYTLITGLGEMLVLGILYGLTLNLSS
jgi:hypothetical protein